MNPEGPFVQKKKKNSGIREARARAQHSTTAVEGLPSLPCPSEAGHCNRGGLAFLVAFA